MTSTLTNTCTLSPSTRVPLLPEPQDLTGAGPVRKQGRGGGTPGSGGAPLGSVAEGGTENHVPDKELDPVPLGLPPGALSMQLAGCVSAGGNSRSGVERLYFACLGC